MIARLKKIPWFAMMEIFFRNIFHPNIENSLFFYSRNKQALKKRGNIFSSTQKGTILFTELNFIYTKSSLYYDYGFKIVNTQKTFNKNIGIRIILDIKGIVYNVKIYYLKPRILSIGKN